MKYISIGMQCTTNLFLIKSGKKGQTYPFDHMYSNPKGVYEILKLLLIEKKTISDIVENYFFKCDKYVTRSSKLNQHHITSTSGILYNSTFDFIFPHDSLTPTNIEKYIRRMSRLKNSIMNQEIIEFIYVSDCHNNDFVINNDTVIKDCGVYINCIYNLLTSFNKNITMHVFHTSNDVLNILESNINKTKLKECTKWSQLVNQIVH